MDINSLTIGEAREIATMFGETFARQPDTISGDNPFRDVGWRIVIMDRGWVLVGNVCEFTDRLVITEASCIRRWGTTKGIGELSAGPLPNTVVDRLGIAEVPTRAVIFTLATEGAKWAR